METLLQLEQSEPTLQHLFSPWRMAYIQSPKRKEGCVFCEASSMPDGIGNLIIYRGRTCYVILNRYPYTSGHLMVVPNVHVAYVEQLNHKTKLELMDLAGKAVVVLGKEYRAQGFNIGINIGESAGAGILEHIHMHIVPRWEGDTNFMASLGNTRVLPESLDETYERLRKYW